MKLYGLLIREGFNPILKRRKNYAGFLGHKVEVTSSTEKMSGLALDVDYEGALVLKLEDETRRRVFGARALNQISTYVKAIALRYNETVVNDCHYQLFTRYFHYFNYNCPLILPRKVGGDVDG